MTHLGDRIAAFVDGELPHDARDYVLTHLAGCAECRAAADAERAAKQSLAGITGPGPSDELTRRLLSLAEPGEPLPPRRRAVDTSTRPPTVPVGDWLMPGRLASAPPTAGRLAAGPFAAAPRGGMGGRSSPLLRRHHRLQLIAAAGVGVAAVALGAAVAIGGREQPGPAVGPGDDWFAVEHAATTGGLPLVDPAMSMTVGFADFGAPTPSGAGSAGTGSAAGARSPGARSPGAGSPGAAAPRA